MNIANAIADWVLEGAHLEYGLVKDWFRDYKIAFRLDGFKDHDNLNNCYEHKFLWRGELDDCKIRAAASQVHYYTHLAQGLDYLTQTTYKTTKKPDKLYINKKNDWNCCIIVTTMENIYSYEFPYNKTLGKKQDVYYKHKGQAILDVLKNRDWDKANELDLPDKGRPYAKWFPKLTIENFQKLF